MLSNSLALVAGKLISLGLGFFAWLLAARLFPPDQVGLASAVIAAELSGGAAPAWAGPR